MGQWSRRRRCQASGQTLRCKGFDDGVPAAFKSSDAFFELDVFTVASEILDRLGG